MPTSEEVTQFSGTLIRAFKLSHCSPNFASHLHFCRFVPLLENQPTCAGYLLATSEFRFLSIDTTNPLSSFGRSSALEIDGSTDQFQSP